MIYFIECGDYIKIGYSKRPQSRLTNLQTSNPYKLELLFAVPGDANVEAEFHSRCKEYWHRGEWFKLSAPLLEQVYQLCGEKRKQYSDQMVKLVSELAMQFSKESVNKRRNKHERRAAN